MQSLKTALLTSFMMASTEMVGAPFVTAHMFCASRDALVSYGWCLLIQGYFCAEKAELGKSTFGIQKQNWG